MTGRIADLTRAAAMAENLPQEMKEHPDAYLTRASMRSTLHRFDEAWADLDEAEKRGAKAIQTQNTRISILAARGRFEEALALAIQARDNQRSIKTLGTVAVLLGEAGRKEEAIAAFREAFDSLADTSPFPVAWLFFVQGQFWEREGNIELALAYYKAVLERFPLHAHAATHAARLAPVAEVEPLLNPLLTSSDDPEVHTVLAINLQAQGNASAAKKHVDIAAKRYDELCAQHPAAFADHAAQFWLDAGNDPKKAFDWAKRNLETRKTAKAYELAVISALANHDRQAACELGTESLTKTKASSMFREIVRGACEKK
jgi:tetratricopeptide (TPR) repeat protein